jgi:hypothetical protein
VVNAIASSYQQTLYPQLLRSLLLAKSEHAPLGVSHRSSPPPAQWPLSRSRSQVVAAGNPNGSQGGVLTRSPIHYAVFFCTDQGFGIEMVQALDEAHAVDSVNALHPDAMTKAIPAASLDEKERFRLLLNWMEELDQSMATGERLASPSPLAHEHAGACSEHNHPGG